MDIAYNQDLGVCGRCGGRCCRNMGCHTHPDDIIKRFGPITEESLRKALLCGDYSADCWDGDVREDNDIPFDESDARCECWFIRARHIGSGAVDKSYGGICANLTKHGCKFSWDERPSGGKALVPQEGGKCHDTSFDKVPAVVAWLPYSRMIEDIVYRSDFSKEWDSWDWMVKLEELKGEGKTIHDLIPD